MTTKRVFKVGDRIRSLHTKHAGYYGVTGTIIREHSGIFSLEMDPNPHGIAWQLRAKDLEHHFDEHTR
jgi:hypothetical protein